MDRATNPFESISPFAIDPFVAQPAEIRTGVSNDPPKTIEEILESINGYKTSIDVQTPDQTLKTESTGNDPLSQASVATPSGEVMNNDPNQEKTDSVPVNVIQSGSSPQPSKHWDDIAELDQLPDFDVRTFAPLDEVERGAPAPIRSAFEVDQDFFDFASVERSVDRLEQLQAGMAAVVAPRNSQPESSNDIFWASPNDTIYVDGKQGYTYIDLACFDIEDVSFEGNQISVRLDSDSQFCVDYRNVTHAMFAGGVEVELAANEIGFDPTS